MIQAAAAVGRHAAADTLILLLVAWHVRIIARMHPAAVQLCVPTDDLLNSEP